jgi:hypothetical protein
MDCECLAPNLRPGFCSVNAENWKGAWEDTGPLPPSHLCIFWWAHQDLNLEPTDYESAALTVELWARKAQSSTEQTSYLGPQPAQLPRMNRSLLSSETSEVRALF